MSHATLNLPRATFSGGKEGGVKTTIEYRGSRRIAFPDKKGPQPKDGETWTYIVLNQNQTKTVWFIRCVALVSEAPQAAISSTGKPATTATAADAEARSLQILTEPQLGASGSLKLGDLGALYRIRTASTDQHLLAVTAGLERVRSMISDVDRRKSDARVSLYELISAVGDAYGPITSAGEIDIVVEVAKQLIAARAEKEQLRVEDRRYASMRSQVARIRKSDGKLPENLSDASLSALKASLEARRKALKDTLEDETNRSQLNRLEIKLIDHIDFLWSAPSVVLIQIDEVITIVNEMTTLESERQSLLEDLASLVDMYEERMAELVK